MLPTNHFNGINSQGYVAYWEKIGDLDLGADLKWPLVVGFRSNYDSVSSPYLGQGWIIPLLESNFVQVSENRFVMMQPDGWSNLFLRGGPDQNVLYGSAGWKGQIRGNQIDAWAPCGWHLTYTRGHLTSLITPKNRQFEFVYSGSAVMEIRESGLTRLQVEQNQLTHEVSALVFNGKRLRISQDKKPQVERLAGQDIVGGTSTSLCSIAGSGGPSKSFEFAVNSQLEPTLKITSKTGTERLIAWDPSTKHILLDGEWTYNITIPENDGDNAEIYRKNRKGQNESWFNNAAKGEEITQSIDGTKTVKSWFTSGILAGQTRKIETIKDNVTRVVSRSTYDDQGRLLRRVREDGATDVHSYEPNQHVISTYRDGREIRKAILDSRERLLAKDTSDGNHWTYAYNGQGREEKVFKNGRLHSSTTYASDNSWQEERVFGDDGQTLHRIFRDEFDTEGHRLSSRNTEYTLKVPPEVIRYAYVDGQEIDLRISDSQKSK